MYSFSYLEPVSCSLSSSNYCFLTCIQISQEAGQVLWYSHLFQNFPQFIVVHTVRGFGIVNKAEVDVFLALSCFFNDLMHVGNLVSGSSAFFKTSLNIWKFMVHVLLKPGLENFEHYFTSMWGECNSEFSFYGESESEVTQSCPTLCDSTECSPPGSSVHRILQATVPEWVATPSSRGSSQRSDQTQVF